MNIKQIQATLRSAFAKGEEYADLRRDSPIAASNRYKAFGQSVIDLEDVPQIDWFEAARITNTDRVDEVLREFEEEPTNISATILVQTIIAAYLKG